MFRNGRRARGTHRIYTAPSFVLVGVIPEQDAQTVYYFETADEQDKPASFTITTRGSQIAAVAVKEPIQPHTIIDALKGIRENESARELFGQVKELTARREAYEAHEALPK